MKISILLLLILITIVCSKPTSNFFVHPKNLQIFQEGNTCLIEWNDLHYENIEIKIEGFELIFINDVKSPYKWKIPIIFDDNDYYKVKWWGKYCWIKIGDNEVIINIKNLD